MEDEIDVLPVEAEDKKLSELEHGSKIDLTNMPTRKERLGYKNVTEDSKYLKQASRWAKAVMCPVCGTNMKLLKGRKGRYSENLTYQCWGEAQGGTYCLTIITVSVGSKFFMRPGDFQTCDFDWQKIADETIRVNDGDKIMQVGTPEPFEMPTKPPPNPWDRNVQSKYIWEVFWKQVIEDGHTTPWKIIEGVQAVRPQDVSGKGAFKLKREVEHLPKWMSDRTGFVVRKHGEVISITGKAKGREDRFPFSDENYRREFGMENL